MRSAYLESQARVELTLIVLQTISLTVWVLGHLVPEVGLEPTNYWL